MIFMNCPKCGAWLAASEVVAAPGYLQCAVCAYVYPAPVLEPVGRWSKLRRFRKWAVAGAILVGILVSVSRLWTGNRSPGVSIEQALSPSAASLVPETETVAPEPEVGGWPGAHENGDASLLGSGEEGGALMVRQEIGQRRGSPQSERPEDH